MSDIIYLEKQDIYSTLTTWIYCHFWMMWNAEQAGINNVYINWFEGEGSLQSYQDKEMFSKEPNMYNWYFRQPKVNELLPNDIISRWTWENDWDAKMKEYNNIGSEHQFMAQPLSVIKEYYKKHLHFNDETNRRGQMLVDKYNIDFSKTIGICWRGTDIFLESANGYAGRQYTPIEYYFEWIDKALEQIPDARIACTAEEQEILNPLFERYGDRAFLIEEFYQVPKGHKHNPERESPMSGYERGLQAALIVWIFSKTSWLIKNRASTSAVASWLSDGNIACINHTEVLGFPPHIDGVEFKGRLYPIIK